MRMMKKIFSLVLVAVLAAGILSCDSPPFGGAATTGYGFAQAIAGGDYAGAYGYLYENSPDLETEEAFAERYTNIFDAMQVENIELVDRAVEENEDRFTLTYTLQMQSALMGSLSYDYQADVIPCENGYGVIFTPSLILPYLEAGDTVRVKTEYGQRGEVFDKNKELLASNDYAQSVYLEIANINDIGAASQTLADVLGLDAAEVVEKYDNAVENGFDLEVVKAYPKYTLTQSEKDALTAVPGIGVDEDSLTPIRYYPMEDNCAHVVGYMGSPSEEEVAAMAEEGITEDSKIGKTGLESAYEDALRPKNGFKLYVMDSLGNEKKVLYEQPAQDGEDLVLTLDSNVQNKAYTLLATNVREGESGAVVVMDYQTGDVEAMVSYPSFDPNSFGFPMDSALWGYLNSEEAQTPLFSKATQAVYPPGSSFKPFSIVPALEGGKITPETVPDLHIVNDLEWTPDLPDWYYPSIKRVSPTLGDFNMMNAMKSSDNIFYAWAALQVGIDPFMAHMNKIGMGEAPSFELPVTQSNLINEGTEMNIKILADMGYGMGELLLSPLQLACMYTALMNDGDMLNPTVVDSIYQEQDGAYNEVWQNARTVFKEDTMQPSTIDTLMQAMHLVVDSGTGYPARLAGVDMVGKTGTAQVIQADGSIREKNWIILIGLDEGNKKLVLVMLDTAKDEGEAKFTIARELMKPADYVEEDEETQPDTETPEDNPDEPAE
jgi:penicillin-binding protein